MSHSASSLERALEGVQAAELLGVVAVGRHDERAAVAVARGQPGDLFDGGERRPASARREVHTELVLVPEVGLGHGGEHPAATCEAAAPGSSARSTTSTDKPLRRALQAHASPISPAPITTAS